MKHKQAFRSFVSLVQGVQILALGSLAAFNGFGQTGLKSVAAVHHAPPTPPEPISRPVDPTAPSMPKGNTLYSIGQPTDEEQLYLEYLNRSRANASAEGFRLATTPDPDIQSAYSFFLVDLNLMQAEFNTNPPVPPLAMNAQLTTAARLHSGDMFTNVYQGHVDTNGATLGTRVGNQGYSSSALGENVFSYSSSVPYGHAGFDVDWGGSAATGGMQSPPGHRNNIHSAGFREVGVGVVDGSNSNGADTVGPQLVTQDFGLASSPRPFITGVVYYDFNGNNFYDLGEGIGGVRVDSPGSAYYTITADSGGYALPVSTNGTYQVTFTSLGLSNRVNRTISSLANLKLDYLPVYTAPVISGPNPAVLNQANNYTFTPVGDASSYDWQRSQAVPYATVEGAESGLGGMTANVSGGYPVVISDRAASGTHSFHLANLDLTDQSLTLNTALQLTAGSQLTFAKMLGYSGSGEISLAQISIDDGGTWADVWTQVGSNGPGESSFSTVTVSLASYSGKIVRLRFLYQFTGGSYFGCADPGCGLYLDNIAVSGAQVLMSSVITSIGTSTNFTFTPTNNSTYLLQVRAHLNSRTLPWNSGMSVSVAAAPPVVQMSRAPVVTAGQIQLNFTVTNYVAGMTFQLWKSADVNGTWAQDLGAALQILTPNSAYKYTTPISGAKTFYKVRAAY